MDAFKVDKWLRAAGLAMLVPRCLLCGERGANSCDLCANCRDGLPWNASACTQCAIPLPHREICGACLQSPPPVTETRAAFVYGFPLDRLVPRFKFHQDLAAARAFIVLEALDQLLRQGDAFAWTEAAPRAPAQTWKSRASEKLGLGASRLLGVAGSLRRTRG